MIYEMTRDLESILVGRKFPYPVIYGPEQITREGYDPAIVVERDDTASDLFSPPRGAHTNPRGRHTRDMAVRATIYARSESDGAHRGDHERECEAILDGFTTALYEWASATRHAPITFSEARYVAPAGELGESAPGVKYILKFHVPRGVVALTFTGEGRPKQKLGGFQNRTETRLAGADVDEDADPELGCGGE